MKLKFCANLSFMYREVPFLERYESAKKSGFTGVECAFPYDFPLEGIKRVREMSGVQQVLINTFPGNSLGYGAIVGKEQEFDNSLARAVDYARALDCKQIHVMSGIVAEPTNENVRTFEYNLKKACDFLRKENMVALIEPISSYAAPKYYLNTFDKAILIMETLNEPNLKLQLDLFHLQQMQGDFTHFFEKYSDLIGHIQIAQVPNRGGPDTLGEINYDYFFQLLQKHKYDGWIGCEYVSSDDTDAGLQWMKSMPSLANQ